MRFEIPDYLYRLKESIPAWMEKLEHPGGIGRYRLALEAYLPYDTLSSSMAHCVLSITQAEHPYLRDTEQAHAWADYLLSYQQEDGHIVDEAQEKLMLGGKDGEPPSEKMQLDHRRGQTRNLLYIAYRLGRLPRYPQTHKDGFRNADDLVAWLEGLHWQNPWGAGSWASAALSFQFFNKLLGDEDSAALIEVGRQWLMERQDPETGTWSDGSRQHKLVPEIRQSALDGTALHCQALALLANLSGLRDELGWVPCTEWHVGYPSYSNASV